MRAWLPFFLVACAAAACGSPTDPALTGGTTSGSGGGSTSSSSSGGAGGACTPWSDSGAACTTSTQCVMQEAICNCDNGALGCRSTVDFSPLPFKGPALLPPDGACCDAEGMTCGGYEDCGPVCTCEGGAWSCKPDVMCEPFACPTDISDLQVLHDASCKGHIGQVCNIGPACGGTFCTCTLDEETAEPSWRCATTPC